MNIEAENRRQTSESRNLNEAEPSLPTDPAEAAAWLEEIWKGRGGWKSQHPLRLKVQEPGDYQALSDKEREQFDKLETQFAWLAEMHGSEMGWSQSYANTNYGEIIGFRFCYDMPEDTEKNSPGAYIFRPLDENKPKVFVSRTRDGWKVESLDDVFANYIKFIEY